MNVGDKGASRRVQAADGGGWPTFAFALVHDLQVGVTRAAGHQQGALVLVGDAVAAAHGVLLGDVGAVWRAHALRPAHLHPADLPRAALHAVAGVCGNTATAERSRLQTCSQAPPRAAWRRRPNGVSPPRHALTHKNITAKNKLI